MLGDNRQENSHVRIAAFTAVGIGAIIWSFWAILPSGDEELLELESKVYINTDSLEQIASLPMIGKSRAMEIIRYREDFDGDKAFNSVADICKVKGIGIKTAEAIAPYISFE